MKDTPLPEIASLSKEASFNTPALSSTTIAAEILLLRNPTIPADCEKIVSHVNRVNASQNTA